MKMAKGKTRSTNHIRVPISRVPGANKGVYPVKADLFEPQIVAFMCNWCTYGAADLAGVSRMQYPSNLRIIRVMCSASVSPHHILRAFQSGADGVMVGG